MRSNLTSDFLNEVVLYGGIPLRRGDVYEHAKAECGEFPYGADMFAYASKRVDGEEAWTLAEFRHMQATGEVPKRFQ